MVFRTCINDNYKNSKLNLKKQKENVSGTINKPF